MTKIQEAYQTMQAEWVRVNDVRVGDKVRCMRQFAQHDLGFDGLGWAYSTSKEGLFNKPVSITDFWSRCVLLKCAGGYEWQFPFFVLEIVDQPRKVEIEVRTEKHYYRDGVDVTDKISEDTKRNLG